MLILSRVCAEFYDKHNNLLDRITPRDLGSFREVSVMRRTRLWKMIPLPELRRKGRKLSRRQLPNQRRLPRRKLNPNQKRRLIP